MVAATALTASDVQSLLSHDWPGNVRELRNAAERYVLLGKLAQFAESHEPKSKLLGLNEQVAEFEKSLLEQTLIECGGSIKATMERLHLPRKTLYDKMQKYQLDKESYKP